MQNGVPVEVGDSVTDLFGKVGCLFGQQSFFEFQFGLVEVLEQVFVGGKFRDKVDVLLIPKKRVQFVDIGVVTKQTDFKLPSYILLDLQFLHPFLVHYLQRTHKPRTPIHALKNLTITAHSQFLQQPEVGDLQLIFHFFI